MNITLLKLLRSTTRLFAFILILGTGTMACQENVEEKKEINPESTSDTAATPVVAKRPAPEFFVVPAELAKKRVWICDNSTSDVFHVKHDCPVLLECKGKGTFRNVTLPRAIEEYGRYNCQECAKELDHIYDEDAIRIETGLGR